jgi:release factor glutamine methyltransferase
VSEWRAEAGRGGQAPAGPVLFPAPGFSRGNSGASLSPGNGTGEGPGPTPGPSRGHNADARPRQYAAGVAGFRLLDLAVDPRVLIPRPETEGLVQLVLDWCAGSGKREAGSPSGHPDLETRHLSVLDLGTGSGCIALSLATEGRFARIVATDVSPAALEVARANLAAVAPALVPELRLGSLFEPVAGERFDVVVSNPPYIAEPEYADLDASVRDFEPRLALVSGPDGLEHTRAILEGVGGHLQPGGLVALEIDSRRGEASAEIAWACGLRDVRVRRDVFGRPRFLLARKDRA